MGQRPDDRGARTSDGRSDPRRLRRAGGDLRAHGGRNRARLRRPAARQLRVRPADHGRRLHARVHLRRAGGRERDRLLPGRDRALDGDGACRLSPATERFAGGHARDHGRDRVHVAGDRAARRPPERRPDRRAGRLVGAVERARHDRGRRGTQAHDRRHPRRRRHARSAGRAADANDDRPAHARRGGRLQHRASAGSERDARHRRRRLPVGAARGGSSGAAHRPAAVRPAGLRAQRDDRRPGRSRGRRDRPALDGDARRLPDRLRDSRDQRSPADRQERLLALRRLRPRDPRAAAPARGALLLGTGADGGASMKRSLDAALQLLAPAVLVVVVGIWSTLVSDANELYFLNALVAVAMVVAIYVFVGNSGVLSFGQISFVAVGAFAAGVLTVPLESKTGVLPELFPLLRDHTVGNIASLALATGVGGAFALVVGLPLMRLSGLAAGIATFAVLEITHNVLREWTKIGPGATTLSLVPETTDALQVTVGTIVAIAVAFAYQRSRPGRLLRATREDAFAAQGVGVSVHRQRLWAFTLSGALAGFAGGLYVHLLGAIMALVLIVRPSGLTGGRELSFRRWRWSRGDSAQPA